MSARLTAPQKKLLNEIIEAGVLYVKRQGPYQRTVEAIERRGLVYISEPDHSRLGQDGWSIVPEEPTDD